jgi:hypothetical protein
LGSDKTETDILLKSNIFILLLEDKRIFSPHEAENSELAFASAISIIVFKKSQNA